MSEPEVKAEFSNSTADQLQHTEDAAAMWKENLYSMAGITIGMGIICFISFYFKSLYLVPSLAASAIMLFMSYNNVFAQPRNVVGGHLMASLAALLVGHFCVPAWWAVTLVVFLTALLMVITHTIHPPAGGTAILAFLGGYTPLVLIGSILLETVIIVLVVCIVNNAISSRKYPLFWI